MREKAKRRLSAVALALLMGVAVRVGATDAPTFRFATVDEGRAVLGARDDFVSRLSPFDRAARLKSAEAVSEARFLEFVGASVLAWEDDASRKRVARAVDSVSARLARLDIALPGDVLLVRTTGREEGGAAYTRGHAIVLPDPVLADAKDDLARLIAHETFHILSRGSKALRTRAYRIIGFAPCPEFRFPADLLDRKITNPDAPRNDHCIEVTHKGAAARAMPVLFASTPYDAAKGGEFFEYLQFKLALVSDAGPRFVDVGEVEGYFEKIGNNTQYIIHPEEILADNFALHFFEGKPVPSPAIPAAVLKAVQDERGSGQGTPAGEGKHPRAATLEDSDGR